MKAGSPALSAHLRTVAPLILPVRSHLPGVPRGAERSVLIQLPPGAAPHDKPVALTGILREVRAAEECIVLVHGLGGSSESSYCRRAAAAAEREGIASLRISLRGADRSGHDFYHVGQSEDLHAVLAARELSTYRRIYVLGFSMGGHTALHFACDRECDPRVAGVIALCTPLDLAIEQRFFDEECNRFYRHYVLRGLKSIYAAVAHHHGTSGGPTDRRALPSEPAAVSAVQTVYDWDRLTIAPRYGFDDPEAFYEAYSVGPRLHELRVPGLLIGAEGDPLVPARSIAEPLERLSRDGRPSARLDVRWRPRAGHISFQRSFDLGLPGGRGLVPQLVAWLRAHGHVPAESAHTTSTERSP